MQRNAKLRILYVFNAKIFVWLMLSVFRFDNGNASSSQILVLSTHNRSNLKRVLVYNSLIYVLDIFSISRFTKDSVLINYMLALDNTSTRNDINCVVSK